MAEGAETSADRRRRDGACAKRSPSGSPTTGSSSSRPAAGNRRSSGWPTFAFDILITDLRLPGIDGRQVLDAALERYPDIIAIVITGFGTVKDAVEAIKQGAADFITKPFQFDALLHVLRVGDRAAAAEIGERLPAVAARGALPNRRASSAAAAVMRDLFQLLETVAATSSTVLITGETGTGKELAARAIHHNSPRRANRFVAINCSAIPETLLEAELFGHVRGAFTGAVGNRQGRLEQAHKGTLFLDEVGTMSPALQAKLLRVLQEREFERVGDSHTIKIDVRVIAATHSDLDEDGRRRHVPRGSVLPPQRHPGAAAAAARASRRHPAARAALPPEAVARTRDAAR